MKSKEEIKHKLRSHEDNFEYETENRLLTKTFIISFDDFYESYIQIGKIELEMENVILHHLLKGSLIINEGYEKYIDRMLITVMNDNVFVKLILVHQLPKD